MTELGAQTTQTSVTGSGAHAAEPEAARVRAWGDTTVATAPSPRAAPVIPAEHDEAGQDRARGQAGRWA